MDFDLYYPKNDPILKSIEYVDGPQIVNAGPGSGKTRYLTTKVAFLLIEKNAREDEVILCTFTEKAAEELKQRIKKILVEQNCTHLDVNKLRVGTIHSILLKIIDEHLYLSPYKSGYQTLDEFSRFLFLYNHLDDLGLHSFKVGGRTFYEFDGNRLTYEALDAWETTSFLVKYFDAIVDCGADALGIKNILQNNQDEDVEIIFQAYKEYKRLLIQNNLIDFGQIQEAYWDLLTNLEFRESIRKIIKYILVDEYQDTNYIQERILLETLPNIENEKNTLTDIHLNDKYKFKRITVVGDFNQSLYRFRGANIDNILTFTNKFCGSVDECKLFKNYRSTENIINLCNEYIGPNFDYYTQKIGIRKIDYLIQPGNSSKQRHPILLFQEFGTTELFVSKIKQLIDFLKDHKSIVKASDIAILLPSIRYREADCFKIIFGNEIEIRGGSGFFSNEVVHILLQIFAQLGEFNDLTISAGIEDVKTYFDCHIKGRKVLSNKEIQDCKPFLDQNDWLGALYCSLNFKIFEKYLTTEFYKIIGDFSSLISTFQNFSKQINADGFFNHFLPFIFQHADDYFQFESEPNVDKIQLISIHQSKGLEFPIVIVGYNKTISRKDDKSKYVEPRIIIKDIIGMEEIEGDDVAEYLQLRRLFYVAFSRSKDLLVIGSRTKNKINELRFKGVDTLLNVEKPLQQLNNFSYKSDTKEISKPIFSYTKDILTYSQCPIMYAFINVYGFQVTSEADFSFGKLVHGVIEKINKHIFSNKLFLSLNELNLVADELFERNFVSYSQNEKILDQKIMALNQVKNFVYNYKDVLNPINILSVEESFEWEENDFKLVGRMDVVFQKDAKVVIVDIKSGRYKNRSEEEIQSNVNQIKLYGNYYQEKYGVLPSLTIYSTGEKNPIDGEYHVEYINIEEPQRRIESIIRSILNNDYSLKEYHDIKRYCSKCAFQQFCKTKIL